jgi:cytochrome c biogenesis protein CcmG/thiol:disulfide interchange protein DsbE
MTVTARIRRRPLLAVFGVIVIGLVAWFAIVAASTQPAVDQVSASPLLYRPAPSASGPGLHGGSVSLASYRGRFVLVNFFASWCAECATEEAQLARLPRAVPGLVVLGVDFDDSGASARRFLAHFHAHFPVIEDPLGQIALRWGVSAPPESFLVAPSGVVLAKVVGPTTVPIVRQLVTIALRRGY